MNPGLKEMKMETHHEPATKQEGDHKEVEAAIEENQIADLEAKNMLVIMYLKIISKEIVHYKLAKKVNERIIIEKKTEC